MNIKTKALLQAIGVTFSVIVTALGVTYLLSLLSSDAPALFSIGALLGIMCYLAYTYILSRLESQEILEKLNSTK
jgi:threonine/homoserine/homoserine lactone efflux protein